MFAVVRTGGKQYRVAEGDKIAVEKLAGDAGDTIQLGEVLLAGEGESLADVAKVIVSAEIIAQAKSEKVTVFKKRRRHNYRRKAGHRQQMTLLRILSVGDDTGERPDAAQAAEPARARIGSDAAAPVATPAVAEPVTAAPTDALPTDAAPAKAKKAASPATPTARPNIPRSSPAAGP